MALVETYVYGGGTLGILLLRLDGSGAIVWRRSFPRIAHHDIARIVVDAAVVVGRAATHQRTRDAVRWLVRNGVLYIATGAWVLGRRWWEARTNARYERLMRAAEAAGDYERLTDWEQRGEQARAVAVFV